MWCHSPEILVFWKLFHWGSLESCACSCETEIVVSAQRRSAHGGEDVQHDITWHIKEGGLDVEGQLYGLLGCQIELWWILSFGDTWRSKFMQFLQDYLRSCWWDFKQLWQQSLPTCEDIFERMPYGTLSSALKWMEVTLNTYCNYEAPMVWSFNNLCHLTVMFILKIECHRTYVVEYFLLVV
jgi:hypothetical protein